ncbi:MULTISPECIES: DUF4870 domain-containing protein [unclassified Lysinibacillus]|uniref:DUF4870 domain-containing protein n=1 Tax=unclassified Lysinibacillus TaxID=2636778 RepID=UPI00131F3BE9|nr:MULTISPECIES: DUF4870 domain-containing protein [unclassified Lysinibacillus]
MDQSKGLSAISYLSYYFAPFIFSLIVFFVTKEPFVKHHAKRAFISHLIPIIFGIIFAIVFIISAFSVESSIYGELYVGDIFTGTFLITLVLFIIATVIIGIWNLIQAIKVLR